MIKNKKYRKAVKEVVNIIIKKHKPKKIILFGSCLWSSNPNDIDMLIVKNTKKKKFSERFVEIRNTIREVVRDISFEPFVITPKEYKKALKEEHPFLMEIIENGEVVYET